MEDRCVGEAGSASGQCETAMGRSDAADPIRGGMLFASQLEFSQDGKCKILIFNDL